MRLYTELCRLLREARKCLRQERKRRHIEDRHDSALAKASRLDHGPSTSLRPEKRGAAEVESAMSAAFGESAGLPKAETIHEVMTATAAQTDAAIAELDAVERELREAGQLPSGDAK